MVQWFDGTMTWTVALSHSDFEICILKFSQSDNSSDIEILQNMNSLKKELHFVFEIGSKTGASKCLQW